MDSELTLVIVVVTALVFDFTNGFHDTANVVATSISTRAMSPRLAVTFAAIFNFVGAFISLQVAATVAKGIVDAGAVSTTVIFAGLVGAIAWNLVTWYFGLPSSSSHALIGGVVGAAFAADGSSAVMGDGLLSKVIVPAIVAPIVAFVVAGLSILAVYNIVGRLRPGPVSRGFRLGQLASRACPYAGPITFMSGSSRLVFGAPKRMWMVVPVAVGSSSIVWSTRSGPPGLARIVRSVT